QAPRAVRRAGREADHRAPQRGDHRGAGPRRQPRRAAGRVAVRRRLRGAALAPGRAAPVPDGPAAHPLPPQALGPPPMPTMNIIQAVNDALRLEMAREPKVVVLGEDVGKFGGVFRATSGLYEEFGPERVIDTP